MEATASPRGSDDGKAVSIARCSAPITTPTACSDRLGLGSLRCLGTRAAAVSVGQCRSTGRTASEGSRTFTTPEPSSASTRHQPHCRLKLAAALKLPWTEPIVPLKLSPSVLC